MSSILVLAPHTDDMEFGCGATIKKMADAGNSISVLVFSTCGQSLPPGFTVEDIKNEQYLASSYVGVPEDNITIYDFPVRRFDSHRQDILEILVQFKRDNSVTQVFVPSRTDIHQDHSVICREAMRAFKDVSLLGYELPWNDFSSSHNFFHDISSAQLNAKLEAIECFRSQQHRTYDANVMRSLAITRGMQIKRNYAEAFELIRWIEACD